MKIRTFFADVIYLGKALETSYLARDLQCFTAMATISQFALSG